VCCIYDIFDYSILPVGISSSAAGGGVVSVILPEGGSIGVGVDCVVFSGEVVVFPVVPVLLPVLVDGVSDILPEGTSAEVVGVGEGVGVCVEVPSD